MSAKVLRKFLSRNESVTERRSGSRDIVVVGKTSKMIKGDYGQKEDQFRRYEP